MTSEEVVKALRNGAESGTGVGFYDSALCTQAADLIERQAKAMQEIDRLMLVIESAVRHDDGAHHPAVLAALKANRAALKEG